MECQPMNAFLIWDETLNEFCNEDTKLIGYEYACMNVKTFSYVI